MTYAEWLKSQGASDEDIKILDTSVGRKAFERMQTVETDFNKFKETAATFQDQVNNYYETEKERRARLDNEIIAAKANEARAVAALRTAHERGMVDVAKDLGYNFDNPPNNPPQNTPPPTPSLDASKYYTREEINAIARSEGQAIAVTASILNEHARLFPDRPLDFESLYSRAVERKIPVKQLWMDEFKVQEARDSAAKRIQDERDNKIRKEEADRVRAEMASQYGNPETRPLQPSSSPFTFRKETGRDKQPWEVGLDGESGSNDRVQRAIQRHYSRESGGRAN
jgi:hypothetical protein